MRSLTFGECRQRAAPRLRAHVILDLFAEIRPRELLHLTWDTLCIEAATGRVDLAKTCRRCIVPFEPCAAALLSALPGQSGSLTPPIGVVRRLKRRAGYLIALHSDAGKVSARLGNSRESL